MADNRTEKPTGRRQEKARKQGQVVRSRDLVAALTLLAVTLLLSWQPQVWISRWRSLFERVLLAGGSGEIGLGTPIFSRTTLALAQWLAPPLLLALAVAVFSTTAQGGFLVTTEPLKPNWGRLNPASNIGHLFSLSGLSRILRSLIPAGAILFLAFSLITRELPVIVFASRLSARAMLVKMGSLLFDLSWKSGLILLAWSGADYLFQRWNHEHSLMMTKQEVKEDAKDIENPSIRGRVRRWRREMRRRMMTKDVARATAVVTNPTHYAVAIEYRPETMAAPVVVAKGRNLVAERIKQIARWHEIPIVENPPLAQALYKAAQVGEMIPPKLYAAVAEILAFLYRAQARMQAQHATGAR